MRVAVFDFGTGNLHTLTAALQRNGADVSVASEPRGALEAAALVLPSVGGFATAASRLATHAPAFRAALASGYPCLGIGLGMHLLFETSEEAEGSGLAAVRGRVRRLRSRRVPHVGWNDVESTAAADPLLNGLGGSLAYYSTSFIAEPADPGIVLAWSGNGNERFPALIRRDRTWGLQFIPEKSGTAGLRLIANFLTIARG